MELDGFPLFACNGQDTFQSATRNTPYAFDTKLDHFESFVACTFCVLTTLFVIHFQAKALSQPLQVSFKQRKINQIIIIESSAIINIDDRMLYFETMAKQKRNT